MVDHERDPGQGDEPRLTSPSSASRGGKDRDSSRRLLWLATGLAAVAFGAMAFLLIQSNSDNSDLKSALADSEQSAEENQQRAEVLEDDLAGLESTVAELESHLTSLEDDLSDAEEGLNAAADVQEAVRGFVATSLMIATPLTESEAACIATGLIEDQGTARLLDTLKEAAVSPNDVSSPALSIGATFIQAGLDCGVSPTTLGMSGSGLAYGDDPALDALHDECADGAGDSCDQLYFMAPPGSEYEWFGGTCGERFPSIFESPARCEGEI